LRAVELRPKLGVRDGQLPRELPVMERVSKSHGHNEDEDERREEQPTIRLLRLYKSLRGKAISSIMRFIRNRHRPLLFTKLQHM
jgi:hypothetical protein